MRAQGWICIALAGACTVWPVSSALIVELGSSQRATTARASIARLGSTVAGICVGDVHLGPSLAAIRPPVYRASCRGPARIVPMEHSANRARLESNPTQAVLVARHAELCLLRATLTRTLLPVSSIRSMPRVRRHMARAWTTHLVRWSCIAHSWQTSCQDQALWS